jgi:hypothetical protein
MATSHDQTGFVLVAASAALEDEPFVLVQGEEGIEKEGSFVVVAEGEQSERQVTD